MSNFFIVNIYENGLILEINGIDVFRTLSNISDWAYMLAHFVPWSLSILPENIRKPLVFWCFQGVQKETNGMKWSNMSEAYLEPCQTSMFYFFKNSPFLTIACESLNLRRFLWRLLKTFGKLLHCFTVDLGSNCKERVIKFQWWVKPQLRHDIVFMSTQFLHFSRVFVSTLTIFLVATYRTYTCSNWSTSTTSSVILLFHSGQIAIVCKWSKSCFPWKFWGYHCFQ